MPLAIGVALWFLLIGSATTAQPENAPVVRAVLFWMRTCPHSVITNVLPSLQEKYGAQLDILFVEEEHPLPSPSEVTASELSQELPLEAGFSPGFELAIAVLIGMILAVIYVVIQIIRVMQGAPVGSSSRWSDGLLIALSVLGMAVAGYLAYVETQAVAAFCGPVGDCNTVQSSPYAKLFGVLPIGVLGVVGYIAILVVWLWRRWGSGRFSAYAPLFILAMTLFGVLFSIYLTYLEPFVIGAVCIWCVSSAIIMTLLMLLSLRPALHVVREYSDAAQRVSED